MRASLLVTASLASFLVTAAALAATTNNAGSCDISVTPAATLLLPYFEVDTNGPYGSGATTLFTITNTSRYPQIAHVTLWSDWSYPVLNFNVFLTGYDVQAIDLFDVIVRGRVVPASVAALPGHAADPGGPLPFDNTSNPNFVRTGDRAMQSTCVERPVTLPPELAKAVRDALTTGSGFKTGATNCSGTVGYNHGPRAVGYVTIDVVSYCTTQFPSDDKGGYFGGPSAPLLFDNVLLGDYQLIGVTAKVGYSSAPLDAKGNSMVHIRAVPEGGLSGASGASPVATNLPFTFYDRYTPTAARAMDRRQPLPSVWAARFIQGGTSGFLTDFTIWREGLSAGQPLCGFSSNSVEQNNFMLVNRRSIIRFDEHDNSFTWGDTFCPEGCYAPSLAPLSRINTANYFPPITTPDLGGWMYLNLSSSAIDVRSSQCQATLSAQRAGFGSCGDPAPAPGKSGSRTTTQSWMLVTMTGEMGPNRLSVEFDAAALGHGCTPEVREPVTVAPAAHRGGALICPANTLPSNCAPATQPPAINP
jgi:hypothetical protein